MKYRRCTCRQCIRTKNLIIGSLSSPHQSPVPILTAKRASRFDSWGFARAHGVCHPSMSNRGTFSRAIHSFGSDEGLMRRPMLIIHEICSHPKKADFFRLNRLSVIKSKHSNVPLVPFAPLIADTHSLYS
ncbi:hypothetical protein PAXRUDRAFT_718377 [Paxillus rubicundulus Ve08.2h10]|uniref:Uncharacterized protein n=1 Tax=Paxillus rubicundulus Ve08.2h10 TaxID=930991 RepID=A0A0D0DKV4_9AGAM|nr:hypothetical protein PAXRUDRAFT_718377 [Paxillus rubicundulus Ve08.2h10]